MAIHVLIESFSVLCPLCGRYLGAEPSAAGKGDCVASSPCIPEATPATLETPQRQALRQAPAANSPFKQQRAQPGGGRHPGVRLGAAARADGEL